MIFRAKAHAKVNLHLGVGAVDEEGYHQLSTVFQSVSAADTVSITPVEGHRVMELKLTTPNREVPLDSSNLAWKAVEFIIDFYNAHYNIDFSQMPGCSIEITKSIPVAGGMAGGSANAAAAMLAANQWLSAHFGLRPIMQELIAWECAHLGADVPFTLSGGTALGTNRGDHLTPMISRGPFHWAMVTNARGLSTGAVFKKLDEMRLSNPELLPHMDTSAVAQAMVSGDPYQLGPALHNDLQPATLSLRPDLRAVYDSGMNAGAIAGLISGSGPTWAFLCESPEQAQEVLAEVSSDIDAASGMVVSSPAGGAQLLA